MRLGQAAELTGLRGILEMNSLIRRPWLAVTRDEIVEWCLRRGLSGVHDPTNSDVRFLRNRLRRELASPLDAVFGSGWAKQFARSAMHLADANAALEILLTPVLMAIVEMSEHCIVLRAELLRGHPLSIQRLVGARSAADDERPNAKVGSNGQTFRLNAYYWR